MVALVLLSFGVANADPRMEISDNFFHMILDSNNTDNKVFVGDGGAQIWTDGAGQANGLARKTMIMSKEMRDTLLSEHPDGVTYTSDDSATACTMVESNGTAYASDDWVSVIKVKAVGYPDVYSQLQAEVFERG